MEKGSEAKGVIRMSAYVATMATLYAGAIKILPEQKLGILVGLFVAMLYISFCILAIDKVLSK